MRSATTADMVLGVLTPYNGEHVFPAEIAEKTGLPEEVVQETLQQLKRRHKIDGVTTGENDLVQYVTNVY